jgi:uncharacterized protein YkwD
MRNIIPENLTPENPPASGYLLIYVNRSDRMAGCASFLHAGLLLTAFFLCAVPRPVPAGMPEPPTASAEALESRTYKLVNEHRRVMGLSPLAYDARIAAVARRHSKDMAGGRVPAGHDGFEARQRNLSKMIPLRGIAENIGMNDYPPSRTVRAAVSGWLGSRGHRENIEGRYDLTGVGIVRDAQGAYYYTQIFVRRKL